MNVRRIIALIMIFGFFNVQAKSMLSHEECENLVKHGLLELWLDQRLNTDDDTFPKERSQLVVAVCIPESFTEQDAQRCGRGSFAQTDAQQDELSFEVVHGKEDHKGYIKISVIRANYDQIKRDYELICRQEGASFWTASTAQQWFDLLQLDQ